MEEKEVSCKKVMFSCPLDAMHYNADTRVDIQNSVSEPATSKEGDFTSGCDNIPWGSGEGIRDLQDVLLN